MSVTSEQSNMAKEFLDYCVKHFQETSNLNIDWLNLNSHSRSFTLMETVLLAQKVEDDPHNLVKMYCESKSVRKEDIIGDLCKTIKGEERSPKNNYRIMLEPITTELTCNNYPGYKSVTIGMRLVIEIIPTWREYFTMKYWI